MTPITCARLTSVLEYEQRHPILPELVQMYVINSTSGHNSFIQKI
jgi:hypothetical protein